MPHLWIEALDGHLPPQGAVTAVQVRVKACLRGSPLEMGTEALVDSNSEGHIRVSEVQTDPK